MTMNWAEFLRTLTWCIVTLCGVASMFFCFTYIENGYKRWKIVVHAVLIVITVLAASIIGGMGWGLTS